MEKEISEISEEEEKELNDRMWDLRKRLDSKKKKLDLDAINEVINFGAEFGSDTQYQLKRVLCDTIGLFILNRQEYALLTEKMLRDVLVKRNLSTKELLQLIALRIRNYKAIF